MRREAMSMSMTTRPRRADAISGVQPGRARRGKRAYRSSRKTRRNRTGSTASNSLPRRHNSAPASKLRYTADATPTISSRRSSQCTCLEICPSCSNPGWSGRLRSSHFSTCGLAARKSRFERLHFSCATTRFARPSSGYRAHGIKWSTLRSPFWSCSQQLLAVEATVILAFLEWATDAFCCGSCASEQERL